MLISLQKLGENYYWNIITKNVIILDLVVNAVSSRVVAPLSVHSAVDKSEEYLGVELRRLRLDPNTFEVDLK